MGSSVSLPELASIPHTRQNQIPSIRLCASVTLAYTLGEDTPQAHFHPSRCVLVHFARKNVSALRTGMSRSLSANLAECFMIGK